MFFILLLHTHYSGNASNDAPQYFYLSTEEGCGISAGDLNSDTLSTIFMEVDPINLGITADLNWNPITDPLLLTSSNDYELYVRNPNPTFESVLITPNLTHQYDAEDCDYFPEFYVEIEDNSGCFSISNIGTDNLLDTISPETPEITDVSVDANGKAVISWTPSLGADFYDVYKIDSDGLLVNIASVPGSDNSYIDINSNASSLSEIFAVRAYDTCGNFSDTTRLHNSINLEGVLDACAYTISLDWNDYVNWNGGTDHYEVIINESSCGILLIMLD